MSKRFRICIDMTIVEFTKEDNPPMGLSWKLRSYDISSSIERVRSFLHTKNWIQSKIIIGQRCQIAIRGLILEENLFKKSQLVPSLCSVFL